MTQIALYRAWRPMDFDSVVAQQQVVQTLKQSVKNEEVAHAYLFYGTRGTGKTSLAKIMARAVNCLNPKDGNPCNECEICRAILSNSLLDVQEIDAASNNSVDNIRRIIDEIVFLPVLAKYKVYIIDEVHMLSPGAFNALLKTLEEPPAHAIFILATTEPHKIPATILSRCQRFDFRRIPDDEIAERLRKISEKEGISIDEEALKQIAVLGDGALRDAISLLDQCKLSFPDGITADKVRSLVGSVNKLFYADLAEALLAQDAGRLLVQVAKVVSEGRDIARFSTELTEFFRDILVAKVAPLSPELISASAEEKQRIAALAPRFSQALLNAIILEFSELLQNLRWADQPRTSLEVSLLKLMGKTKPVAPAAPVVTVPATPAVAAPAPVIPIPAPTPDPVPVAPVPAPAPAPAPVSPAPALEPEPTAENEDPFAMLTKEDLALLSPELLASYKATTAQNPQTARPTHTQATEPAGPEQLLALWKDTLETLSVEDPYLFLFAREAEPKAGENELELGFAEKTRHHYNVLSGPQGQGVFKIWDETCRPLKISLKLVKHFDTAEAAPVQTQADDSWMKRIREVAEELNVPFENELED